MGHIIQLLSAKNLTVRLLSQYVFYQFNYLLDVVSSDILRITKYVWVIFMQLFSTENFTVVFYHSPGYVFHQFSYLLDVF